MSADLEALQAIVAARGLAHLASLAEVAASPGAAAVAESRAARITGYYIAGRILDYPLDLTQAYLSLRAARLGAFLTEGDSPRTSALDEIENEALRRLTEARENATEAAS